MVAGEYFSFDLSEVEPAVILEKVYDSVKLFIDEAAFVCNNGNTYDSGLFTVLCAYF